MPVYKVGLLLFHISQDIMLKSMEVMLKHGAKTFGVIGSSMNKRIVGLINQPMLIIPQMNVVSPYLL